MDYLQYLSSPDLVRVVSITLAFSLFLYYSLLWKTKGSPARRLPPQARRAWPIIGHLRLLVGSEPAHLVLAKMADKYGPFFTVKMGVHRAVVVSSSELAKECLKNNDKVFASRPKCLAAEIMGYNYAFFPTSPDGLYFRQMRKIVMLNVLSNQHTETLKHIRESEVKASIKQVYERCCMHKSNNNIVLVDMKEWFGVVNNNVTFRMIIGKRYSEAMDNHSREILREYQRLRGTLVVSDWIPMLRWLDLGGHEKAMKKVTKEMDHMVEGWLQEHKHKKNNIYGQVKGDNDEHDFMDAMLDILDTTQLTTTYDGDTIIKATTLVLLLASIATTADIMTWALASILNKREALKKAQQELDQTIGRQRQVNESDTENLVYIQAIIKETLRLYNGTPIPLPHESTEGCIVGGYHVPAGTRLLVNLLKIHRDPKVWSDPIEFRPERFLTTHKSVDVKGQDFELLPFGSGRRMCPGMSLSLKFLHFTLASLLHGFDITTPADDPVDMSEEVILSNSKATPLEVLLTPRLPAQLYE